MPAEAGKRSPQILFEAEIQDEIAERKGLHCRPDGTGQLESVDPWPKTVKGKGAQKSPFSGGPMGDQPAVFEEAMDFGPELQKPRRPGQILRANAVDLARGPGNRLICKKEAGEAFGNLEAAHQGNSDLDRHFRATPADTRTLKIHGRERGLGNNHALSAAEFTIAQLVQDHARC
jgi:hypothetical protein